MRVQLRKMVPDYLQCFDRVLVHFRLSHGENREHAGFVEHWDNISAQTTATQICQLPKDILQTISIKAKAGRYEVRITW